MSKDKNLIKKIEEDLQTTKYLISLDVLEQNAIKIEEIIVEKFLKQNVGVTKVIIDDPNENYESHIPLLWEEKKAWKVTLCITPSKKINDFLISICQKDMHYLIRLCGKVRLTEQLSSLLDSAEKIGARFDTKESIEYQIDKKSIEIVNGLSTELVEYGCSHNIQPLLDLHALSREAINYSSFIEHKRHNYILEDLKNYLEERNFAESFHAINSFREKQMEVKEILNIFFGLSWIRKSQRSLYKMWEIELIIKGVIIKNPYDELIVLLNVTLDEGS